MQESVLCTDTSLTNHAASRADSPFYSVRIFTATHTHQWLNIPQVFLKWSNSSFWNKSDFYQTKYNKKNSGGGEEAGREETPNPKPNNQNQHGLSFNPATSTNPYSSLCSHPVSGNTACSKHYG